jgi:hypothetical protein
MLTEGIYRSEVSASFELSGVYTAPLVRLWWMIVVCDDSLDFRIFGFGPFCHSTPPYPGHQVDGLGKMRLSG